MTFDNVVLQDQKRTRFTKIQLLKLRADMLAACFWLLTSKKNTSDHTKSMEVPLVLSNQ